MPAISVSKTKIIPPRRRAELLTRQRLLDQLFESLDKRLILLSAPAGYGKTSLLIDLVDHSELPCCWLSLDELDSDPQRFITYFIAAIGERFPNFGAQSISVLSGLKSFESDLEELIVTLVNESYEQINEHFIFVLDDFHLVEQNPTVQRFVNRFVQLTDENCHLVISSRVLVGLPELPLMAAREQISGLSFSDLTFRVDEIQALLEQNSNRHVSDAEAQKLLEDTEGWIAGLQFSEIGMLAARDLAVSLNTGVRLFDYLGQQVLDRQSPAMRDFLLRSSLLEEFDAALCESVLSQFYEQPQDWPAWIRSITQNNLFALPVGDEGKSLRYHHLFRDFLQEQYRQAYAGEVPALLSSLSQAYEKLGEWEKAHRIKQQIGDADSVAAVVERASVFMIQRASLTLEAWLDELPPSMQQARPGLLSLRGALLNSRGELRGGLELLDRAVHAFREAQDLSGLTLALVRRSSGHRLLGDYTASMRDADEVIRLLEADDALQILYAEALRDKGLALHRLGDTREAIGFLERSLLIGRRMNDASHIATLMMEVGLTYNELGRYAEAADFLQKAFEIWKKQGTYLLQAYALNNMGVMYQGQGEYEKAAAALEEGLLCAQRSHRVRSESLIAISLGDLCAEVEAIDLARQNYEYAHALMGDSEDRFLVHALGLSRAALALQQKDPELALELVSAVEESIHAGESQSENGLLNLILGRALLMQSRQRQAVPLLEQAERLFSNGGRESEGSACRVWLAAAYHQNGARAKADAKIKSLFSPRGTVANSVIIHIHWAHQWLQGLEKESGSARVVADLFAQATRLAERLPAVRRQFRRQSYVMRVPAAPLIIQAFGSAQVWKGGKAVTVADWQTQSVRDLFFYLLKLKKPATKEQIGAALWADPFDLPKLRLRFKNEVYRLRRAVVQDILQYEDIYYGFNRNLDFEYDVEAFESFVAAARATNDSQKQTELYRKAVDLVHGPYLEDIYADWVVPERERLNQIYLNALIALAELYLQQGQLQDTLMICQRATEYDPLFEPAYRISMQVYGRLGDAASVTRVYQACRQIYLRQFDLPPSEELEQLYRRLLP